MIFTAHQPNFLPYLGVFYKIYMSDNLALLDNIQYSNEGLHNANYIMINKEKKKITVPVSYKFGDKIKDVKIDKNNRWKKKMLTSIQMNYSKSEHFDEVYELIKEEIEKDYEYLVDLNINLMKKILDKLEIKTKIYIESKDFEEKDEKNERLIYQCKKTNSNVYLSGKGGKSYNNEEEYNKNGIKIIYNKYDEIEYDDSYDYKSNYSILDYLFKKGFVIPKEWKYEKEKFWNIYS